MTLKPTPSSANLWGTCSASLLALSEQIQTDKTTDQLEGLAAHEYLENTLMGEVIEEGQLSSYGVPYTLEMIEAAAELIEDIRVHNSYLDKVRNIRPFLVEAEVAIPSVHEKCSGRVDAARVDPSNRVVYVFEYKFGHSYVDEYENPTGVLLAEGLRIEAGITDADWPSWSIHYTIAQPRCFDPRTRGKKLRTHTYNGKEHSRLLAHLKAMVIEAQLDPREAPNDQCSKCPKALSCGSLRATTALICDISMAAAKSNDMSFEELENELRFLEDAQRRLKARQVFLEASVFGQLSSGVRGRYFTLERGATIRVFNKTAEELKALEQLFKIEGAESPRFMAEPKPLTYLQAKALPENQALVAGGFFDADDFTKEVSGKTTLKRINHNDAKRAFSKEA